MPESRLLLKGGFFHVPEAKLAAIERCGAHGIDASRLLLEDATDDYMERMRDEVDVLLDTYPYPGGGITCDALYMGVPVIARYGAGRGSRYAASILAAAGLSELATATDDDYVARAIGLARDTELLDVLHHNLRTMMFASPLMDTRRCVQEMEAAYTAMWAAWEEKQQEA